MNSTLIQIYNGVTDKTGDVITVESALNRIVNGTYKKEIERLRSETDSKKRDALKRKLPAVTFSGTFSSRKAENLIEYSNLICIDLDKLSLDILFSLNIQFRADRNIYAFFTSPSGNGLKVLFKTISTYTEHQKVFISLQNYFKTTYDINIDESGKDICRLCFLSSDEHLHFKNNCDILESSFFDKWYNTPAKKTAAAKKPAAAPAPKQNEKSIDSLLDEVRIFTNNKLTYVDGERNNYVHLFACNANRKGIEFLDTFNYCNANFIDLDATEIQATVKSAYEHNAHETATFAPKQYNAPTVQNNASKPAAIALNETIELTDKIDFTTVFWYKEINEKTNKETIKFSYDDGTIFLQNNGFYKIPVGENRYQFVRVKNNVIDIVVERNMREFMLDYLNTDFYEFKPVREMFKRGAKMYSNTQYLESLKYIFPKFKKDTETTAFVYFKNNYLEITKTGIVQKKYTDIDGYIWTKQINNFDLELTEYTNCYFDKFLQLAILGKHIEDIKDYAPEEKIKMQSVMSSIGYLLHKYKNPANPKVIVGVDKKMRTGADDNGGSGKSLFLKAISKLTHTCTIDGKNFKFDSPYPFEKLNIDHSLINFNDVTKNFDFERLFGLITEEFTFSKKYIDAITIAYEDSPKMYISTNKSIKGGGASYIRRQHVIEFTDYFNDLNTPQKEFGHMFFSHWDNAEFSQFYIFLINCIRFYLEHGLIDFPLENYGLNKLIDTAGDEFVDYMNDNVLDKLATTDKFELKKLFDGFIDSVKGSYREKTQQNTFSKNCKGWANLNELEINAHKNGERDRSNGTDYLTFTSKQN